MAAGEDLNEFRKGFRMPRMNNLVTADWLWAHRDDELTVLDCTNSAIFDPASDRWRTTSGGSSWRDACIAGSRHADFTKGLSGNDPRYRNSLPDPAAFAQELSEIGVASDRPVILYDSAQSMWAARLWWMLRWIGLDNAWLLDGGLQAWTAAGYPVANGRAPAQPAGNGAPIDIALRPECFVTSAAVRATIDDGGAVLIDALSREQFAGTGSELGLCGHIPNAINVPADELVDARTRCFLPPDDLRAMLPDVSERPVIVYCGSGVAAAAVAFCLNQLGFGQVAIYMPGFQEWVELDDAPVDVG
jgi:thiosulfate/3-mercaptopyruvate sulfurtransferase